MHLLPRLSTGLALLAVTTTQALAQAGAADIIELLCGRTVHYHTPVIGNQIEYTHPDGSAYLWHPLAGDMAIGTWELEFPDGAPDQVCYTYPDGSFGPGSGGVHCFTYPDLIADIPMEGLRDGDPYDLSTGNAPFALPAFPPILPSELAKDFPAAPRGPGCEAYVS